MDLDLCLSEMKHVASEAGGFIRRERERFQSKDAEIKGRNDLVSYVDRGSEQIIVDHLKKHFPEVGFITEENTASERKAWNWIIDPLDGTTNFVHGIACYAVSIGLEHQGAAKAGVVYEVARDELFYAAEGSGAFCNGQRIHVTSVSKLEDSLIATGFPVNNFSRMSSYLQTIDHLMRNTHGIRRIGAAAADLCFLAAGRVDAFFEYNLNPWDVAAGGIIVKEAGGVVTDFKGGNDWLFGREICAANPSFHKVFQPVIAGFF